MSSSVSSAAGRARRWQSPALAAVMLCVLVVAGTATNPVAAQSFVDRHVVFDNSASKAGHHHSETHLVGPSSLRTESGRIPVDTARFASAPNSLRLEWRSVPGGEWRATVPIPGRYARKFRYEGDALVLQVFASDSITAANSLRISLRDDTGFTSPTIDLIRGRDTLAAGRWTEIVIPFSEFRLPFQGTDDRRFQPELLAAVNLMQGLDDGKPHTLWIDDILVRPSSSADREAPAPATDLRVAAVDLHGNTSVPESATRSSDGTRLSSSTYSPSPRRRIRCRPASTTLAGRGHHRGTSRTDRPGAAPPTATTT